MKILWVNPNFLHPTTKGGQIRTLEMLRCLHRDHEIHYVAFADAAHPEGPARAGEYSTRAYPIAHQPPARGSLAFAAHAALGLASPLPLAVSRWHSPAMSRQVETLLREHTFDSVVCDFLAPAPNFSSLAGCILFQHNVETVIWRRHAETAKGALRRAYFGLQAKRMESYERACCRQSQHVIAVSETDAKRMREWFQIPDVSWVPTGVDLDYFSPSAFPPETVSDLVFTGSMDWMPNIDGILWFTREVLPLITTRRPDVRIAIVGRDPGPELRQLAVSDARIRVTGTVADIRPWLWGSTASIVPLRVGGGTRLKIFEAVAAGIPVISTTIGAEGLPLRHPDQILLADSPADFATACVDLLEQGERRAAMAQSALDHVAANFSWASVTARFAAILERFPYRQP
jgi:polysaccharide biosynthesis protein PslH